MKTAPLVLTVVAAVALPALLSSIGCNKKEDPVPMPAATTPVAPATQVAAPPTVAPPTPPTTAPTNTIPLLRTTPLPAKGDGGAAVAHADAGAAPKGAPTVVGLPPGMPTIAMPAPSELPGLASSIVGGIMTALPPIVPPPAASH